MKKIKWWLEMGTKSMSGEMLVNESLTENGLEEEVKQEVFNNIEWGFEEIKNEILKNVTNITTLDSTKKGTCPYCNLIIIKDQSTKYCFHCLRKIKWS